jgi:hypothetical protein
LGDIGNAIVYDAFCDAHISGILAYMLYYLFDK